MFVVEKFKSTYKMSEWVSRPRNTIELKRKYPPKKGYKIYVNLVEQRVEVHDEEVTIVRPEDKFYTEIKEQVEAQLAGVNIFLDEDTGIILAEKRGQPTRKVPVGVLSKRDLGKLVKKLGEDFAIKDTMEHTVIAIIEECNRMFNLK